MKTFIYLILVAILITVTSCLSYDLPSVESSSQKDISNFGFNYRYLDTIINTDAHADTLVEVAIVWITSGMTISNDTIYMTPQIPSSSQLPTDQLPYLNINNIWAFADISDGATIESVENAPKIGTRGDYSMPVSYKVTAGDGTSKIWVIVTKPFS